MKIIAVVSPKGGSGKSTLTRNLAAAAAGDGCRWQSLIPTHKEPPPNGPGCGLMPTRPRF
ncbi:hypothetical protein [Azospirillum formosense]|uniref:ParA family protein n=1 Tax=Azospirillum formosense TaxID=861533 RepID=UPI001C900A64|nr:hypothetical protein [Azospirillum formosense]